MAAISNAAPLPAPSIRRRLASMVYEAMLLVAVVFFGFLVPNILIGIVAQFMPPPGILLIHVVVVIAVYFIWFWHRDGRTLAMQTWKIRLVSKDGARPGMDQLVLRFLLAWPCVLSGAGLAWALIDPDRQFLHDRLSGTRLVSTG